MLSDVTEAWQLYFGLLFIGMVMFAPSGIAGLLARQKPLLQARQLHRVVPFYALALLPGLVTIAGLSMVIEMTYQLTVHASDGPTMVFCHIPFNATAPLPWLIAVVLLIGGRWLFLRAARVTGLAYGEALAVARSRRPAP